MSRTQLGAAHLVWPDLIRIFAITGVVTIHAFVLPPLAIQTLNFETFFNWNIFILLKTCVPLFLMLSGALLLGKSEPDQKFYLKRIQRIGVPWIFWTVIFLGVRYQHDFTGLLHIFRTLTKIASAEFSFLPALFCLYLLMPFFRTVVKHNPQWQRWQLIGFWFIGVSLLPYLRNSLAFPAVVDNGLVRQTINYSGFILLGFELKVWLEKIKNSANVIFLTAFIFITSTLGTFYLQLHSPSDPPLFLSYVAPLIIISAISAFTLLSVWGLHWRNHPSKKILQEFSQASLGVFFVHPLVVQWLTPTVLTSNLTWKNLLLSLLSLSFSFLVILGLRELGLKKLVS